jgi:hypothetical protein
LTKAILAYIIGSESILPGGRKMKKYLITISTLILVLSLVAVMAPNSAVRAATGGPDHFGYRFIDSDEPDGPTYSWIDATGGTWLPDISDDDDEYELVPIGFSFDFYGNTYTEVYVTSNGILTFDEDNAYYWSNSAIPKSSTPNNMIAPFWDDLYPDTSGDIYYETQGTAPHRRFIAEWDDVAHIGTSPSGATFEAILYEGSNNILFQYSDVDFGEEEWNFGVSATVGIENANGTVGLQYSRNETSLASGLAILFYPASVGGELFPVNKLSVLAPWLALALLLALGGGFVVMRRRLAR